MLKYLKGSHNKQDVIYMLEAMEHTAYYLQKGCDGMCKECSKRKPCSDVDSLIDYLKELLN